PEAAAHPQAEVVEVGTGDRGVGGDALAGVGFAYRFPAQHGAPVVAEQVDGVVRGEGVDDGVQVGGEVFEPVVRHLAGDGGGAGAAVVVAQDAEVVGEQGCDAVPQGVGVGPAVDEDEGRSVRVAFFDDVESDGPVGDGVGGHGCPVVMVVRASRGPGGGRRWGG